MQHTFSLHKIHDEGQFGFSPKEYSRFKFGDTLAAQKFGTDLAHAFIAQVLKMQLVPAQMVVISSPYSFIPTATFAMKDYFVFTLNRWLAGHGHNVIQETRVHRTITYKEDYGALDAEQRMNLIGGDSFHIDKDFLAGKTLLFLDDIKITGSHERMITKMLTEYGLQNETYLLYFAELENKSIHPNIENYLNYYFVKSIFDLDSIIKSERFAMNTRIVKYILNTDPAAFKVFVQNQSSELMNLLYDLSLGNGYHTIEAYQPNLNQLRSYLSIAGKAEQVSGG